MRAMGVEERRVYTRSPHAIAFGPEGRRLFGWAHPAPGATRRDAVVVLCAPLGRETTGVPRAYRHWANTLAADGFATIRFDLYGTGDSAGCENDADLLRMWVEGLNDAIDLAREWSETRSVILAGVHFGATLAIAAATERRDIDGLVLWGAVPTGKAFLREGRAFTRLLGEHASGELEDGAEQIGGLALTAETIAALQGFDPLAAVEKLNVRALLVARDEATNDDALAGRLDAAGMTVTRAQALGYAALMEDAHKAELPTAMIEASLQWARETFVEMTPRALKPLQCDGVTIDMDWSLQTDEEDATGRIQELPVKFGDDARLFGVLARSLSHAERNVGIIIANAGSVPHVGPNRLYVNLARRWAALGYTTLRMDLGGLGESSLPPNAAENESYPSHAVADVAAGVAALRAAGAERVIVAGLCSGAHTSFHVGLELEGIDGLLIVNPIVFYWKESDPLDVGAWVNYVQARYYKQAALRWQSWKRLAQGKADIGHLAKVGVTRARDVVRAKGASLTRRFRGKAEESENVGADLRRIVERGTQLLLLFSEGDPGHDFLRLNYPRELRELRKLHGFELQVVSDADHTFTAPSARHRAERALTEYLLFRHP